ncbi:hypothetical protein A3770_08p52220 [Chloropicon primus]|uniref:VWFA domain-containing protein n=2 Tax=Chloropicon primus TaxID=1764295 RepID=A0A5B8MS19_9CHLO|nr:hypothetical protein A3770_08p52220 [Chloropicon primus]|eukprot:QDZ22704.1 hypothetical protein A3770_08p52220 [Chloropicon primus]
MRRARRGGLRRLCKSHGEDRSTGSVQLETLEVIQSLGPLGERLLTLPRTTVSNLQSRVESLKTWQSKLQRGVLPTGSEQGGIGEGKSMDGSLAWPEEPFQGQLLQALAELDMASLTRRFPKLTNTLLANMMDVVEEFEASYVESDDDDEAEEEEVQDDDQPPSPSSIDVAQDSGLEPAEGGDGEEITTVVENAELAEDLLAEFRKEWEPIAEALDTSEQFFEDLGDMVQEQFSHDIDTLGTQNSVWKHTGWKEIKELSRKLERLPQLRKLVRDLGRGSRGRGPKRLANAEEYMSGNPEGLITSNLVIEETAGVFRSGEIMNMLPSEASLLAAGRGNGILKQLWHSKRMERSLLSYERVGWMDDEDSNVLERMEIRPSGVQGPIILCLDTSASMAGDREKVAKALVLECVRGAKQQQRKCYLIAFSGKDEVKELELSSDVDSMKGLLEFLGGGFDGGTDINEPISRSISLLRDESEEWSNADILIVTDSEIPALRKDLREEIHKEVENRLLQIHGLVVGPRRTSNLTDLCTEPLHIFNDWDVFKFDDAY